MTRAGLIMAVVFWTGCVAFQRRYEIPNQELYSLASVKPPAQGVVAAYPIGALKCSFWNTPAASQVVFVKTSDVPDTDDWDTDAMSDTACRVRRNKALIAGVALMAAGVALSAVGIGVHWVPDNPLDKVFGYSGATVGGIGIVLTIVGARATDPRQWEIARGTPPYKFCDLPVPPGPSGVSTCQ